MKNTSPIFFERILKGDNTKLIKASELRRKVSQSIEYNNNGYDHCAEYYEELKKIIDSNAECIEQPLFTWGDESTTCWLFEQINILRLLSHWSIEKTKQLEPKEAKQWYLKAVNYEMESLSILKKYLWKDSIISNLPIMQDRFHLSRAILYAGDYYHNMYKFKECLEPIKRAYQLTELASHTWKGLIVDDQMKSRKALTLRQMAHKLTDDDCGERVALMEEAHTLLPNDINIVNDLKLWKDQNESVYYDKVETDKQITFLSLHEFFRILSTMR